jgi:hypothetical protein
MTGELRSCPKCGLYRVSWNGMSRHWLCLTIGCNYSTPPDPDQLTEYEKARKYDALTAAIKECHGQHADDRCWMDFTKVYEAAGLPPPDNSVGDKVAMRKNCDRFVDHYCEGGGNWPSYAELEKERDELRAKVAALEEKIESYKEWALERDTLE